MEGGVDRMDVRCVEGWFEDYISPEFAFTGMQAHTYSNGSRQKIRNKSSRIKPKCIPVVPVYRSNSANISKETIDTPHGSNRYNPTWFCLQQELTSKSDDFHLCYLCILHRTFGQSLQSTVRHLKYWQNPHPSFHWCCRRLLLFRRRRFFLSCHLFLLHHRSHRCQQHRPKQYHCTHPIILCIFSVSSSSSSCILYFLLLWATFSSFTQSKGVDDDINFCRSSSCSSSSTSSSSSSSSSCNSISITFS